MKEKRNFNVQTVAIGRYNLGRLWRGQQRREYARPIDTMNIRYFPGSAKYLSKQQFRTLMCRCKDNVCRANMAIPATPRASYLRVSYRTDMINISVLINSSETSGAAERSATKTFCKVNRSIITVRHRSNLSF